MESAEKEALAGSEEQRTENSPFFFLFPNNIFIITTLHLLPLLQISCWKKWTRTKDPGESWDSALIGKPFNILKYNLTFLSIEEPPRGRVAGGNTLYSHGNLLARTNKRLRLYCSRLSRRCLEPHNPIASWHCHAIWAQSTTPLENPKCWVMV